MPLGKKSTTENNMEIETDWHIVKKLFKKAFSSSFHYSIASIDIDGKPHVTPIGSLILGEPGHAIYFEEFTRKLPINLKSNKFISVLAVNSSKWFWLKSLIKGKFAEPPALRLNGEAGIVREATQIEVNLWHKRVKSVNFTKGHKIMWQRMAKVREIEFTSIEQVHLGEMTMNVGSNKNV